MSSSISSLMNAMVGRLEFTQKETLGPIPEDKYWKLIQIYVGIDEVLAALYKQYCDTKDNLGKLVIEKGSEDAMTEIAWDTHDSARSAVEARLLELKEDESITTRVRQIQSLQRIPKTEFVAPPTAAQSLEQTIAFLLMASMVMKTQQKRHYDVRRDFIRAS